MSLEIPENPTEIRINFHHRTTKGEVIKLLNFLNVMRIQNRIEEKILKIVLTVDQSDPLNTEAKKCLQEIADQGNLVSFK